MAASSDGNTFTSAGIDTSGADLLVVAASWFTSVEPALSDSLGNTWTPLTQHSIAAAIEARLFYVRPGANVGSGHTFTLTETGFYGVLGVLALSGSVASPFDVENGATVDPGTSLQTGSVTPTEDNELIVAVMGLDAVGSNIAIDGGFTLQHSVDYVNAQHQAFGLATLIQTTATAANPTWSWTNSVRSAVGIASFKAAAGGGASSGTTALRKVRKLVS